MIQDEALGGNSTGHDGDNCQDEVDDVTEDVALAQFQQQLREIRQAEDAQRAQHEIDEEVLAHPGRWGAFTFSLKQPKRGAKFGAYECSCPFHRKECSYRLQKAVLMCWQRQHI